MDFLILPIEDSLAGSRELQSCRLDAGDQSLFVGVDIADAIPTIRRIARFQAPICPEHDPLTRLLAILASRWS